MRFFIIRRRFHVVRQLSQAERRCHFLFATLLFRQPATAAPAFARGALSLPLSDAIDYLMPPSHMHMASHTLM